MNRTGSIVIQDPQGRDRERYEVVYGAKLRVTRRRRRSSRARSCSSGIRTPSRSSPRKPGIAKFKDVIDGITVHEEVDEVTGLARRIIIDSPDDKKQPLVEIRTRRRAQGAAQVPHAVARPPHGRGRRGGLLGSGARQDPARDHQDQGHHRRSAARRRAVRGAQAARPGRGHQRRSTARCRWARDRRASARSPSSRTRRATPARSTSSRAACTSTSRKASASRRAIR